MKRVWLYVLAAMLAAGTVLAVDDARLLRTPDINKDLVTFVYAGDIWSVPAKGGEAKRLTSHKGMELYPRISPDGQWIAFSGEYSGTRQIFVIPAKGGTPKQLTYYNDVGEMPPRGGFDNVPVDWTHDSKKILVRANRTPWSERIGKYYYVSVDGGLEEALQIPEAGFGTFSADGKKIAYTPISREWRTWKRTKGGRAQDVWTYDLVNDKSQRITTFPGTDHHPYWYKDKIYYVSDRDLVLNFWCYDLKTQKHKQVTAFKDFDVLWPGGNGHLVAFEKGGFLHVLNLETGKTNKITVSMNFDNPHRLPYFKNVSRYISRFGSAVSPDGKRAVFDARGDIFTVPAKADKGRTINHTRTQGIREQNPSWSPDGKWIAFISDKTGDYEIYLMDPKGKKKTKQLTKNHKVWKPSVTWSPDSKMILCYDLNRTLQIIDIAGGAITVVDKGTYGNIDDYDWSADSKWITYSATQANRINALFIYSVDKKKKTALSTGEYNDEDPVFSKCGKYIFFISDRDFNMGFAQGFSSMEFDYVYNKTSRIYAMALTKDAPNLFKDPDDMEEKAGSKAPGKDKKGKKGKKGKGDKKGKKGGDDKAKPLKIDFDGIKHRISVFPIGTGSYNSLYALDGKLLYTKRGEVRLYDLKERKDHSVIKGVGIRDLSADGKKMLVRARGKWAIMGIKPGLKMGKGTLDLSGLVMKIDPVKEWRQIYNDAWRIYRDWFYVSNMHGVDWEKMRKKYAPLVEHVGHRFDLDFIFGELIGELNAGHTYVNWGDFEQVKRVNTGLLGAELKADKKAQRYKIVKIYKGENWNEDTRSPLTEQGVNVKVGDYIIKLNGHDVKTEDNPYRFLENTAKKKITITVNNTPNEAGARTYYIKPVSSELQLRYVDWVESRRKLVDKLSNGKIGYIHVPNTAIEGNRELFKGIYAYSNKEAFIIDDRYNGGGWTPGKMIRKLWQRTNNYWYRRGLEMRKDPAFALDGPKVMLMNHYSSSGGDDFPYLFKLHKLGKLIGTRTWGGLIGYGWSPTVVDGPRFAVPMSGIVNTKGELVVEGVGIYPDIEVYDLPEEIAKGNDPCIKAAVDHLLKELKKKPTQKVTKPAEPDRSKWFEHEIK